MGTLQIALSSTRQCMHATGAEKQPAYLSLILTDRPRLARSVAVITRSSITSWDRPDRGLVSELPGLISAGSPLNSPPKLVQVILIPSLG